MDPAPGPPGEDDADDFPGRIVTLPAGVGPAPREDGHRYADALRRGKLRRTSSGTIEGPGPSTRGSKPSGRSTWVIDEIGVDGAASALDLKPGDTVPGTRYEVVRWIGDGAMGVVYEGEHKEIGRRAALKVMRIEASRNVHAIKLFRNEARHASQIGSDAIVQALDFTELPDGRLLFAMEYVPGASLDRVLERGPLAPARLIAVLRQAGQALAAAHAAGIIHRDIKPENLMIQDDSELTDRVRILDFGVAAITAQVEMRSSDVVGSPFYMAPEIIAGEPYDARVDLYSLGCTGYELLTGEPPFVRDSIDEVLRAHMTERPRSLAEAADVPAALDRVILKMLGKSAAERHANMGDFIADLIEAQIELGIATPWDHLPIPTSIDAERRGRLERGLKLVAAGRRSRWPFLLAGAAVVAALGTTAYFVTREPEVAPIDQALARIDGLTAEARAAAARRFYVYPSPDDPGAATAYTGVLQLESIPDGRAGSRASELRGEFAAELRTVADAYWGREPGSATASEFYAMVVMFDPDDATATERLTYDETELDDIRELARGPTFPVEDLVRVEPLQILMEGNEALRRHRLKRYRGRTGGRHSGLEGELDALAELPSPLDDATLGGLDRATIGTEFATDGASERVTGPEPDEADTADGGGEVGGTADGEGRKSAAATRDAAAKAAAMSKARQLARQGDAAMAASNKGEAKGLYEEAIALHPRLASAHQGLALLYFERSNFGKAAQVCGRAARLAPRDGDVHLLCGDAFYRLGKHDKALAHYRKALDLGTPGAKQRVAKLGG